MSNFAKNACFVEYARINKQDQYLREWWDDGVIWRASSLVYNSVKGSRDYLKQISHRPSCSIPDVLRCALKMLEKQEHTVSKKRMFEEALVKLDPTYQPVIEPVYCCHAPNCTKKIDKKYLMCAHHWYMVPRPLQATIWRYYRPGQEDDGNLSREYGQAVHEAKRIIAELEGGSK